MSDVSKVVFFVGFGLALGAVVEFILFKIGSPVPYKVVVFYVGILFALACKLIGIRTGDYIDDNELSTDIMLYGLLPTLLFNETMHLNLLHFRRSFNQSALIAGPGGIMTACLLALSAYVCLPFNWSWNYNFLFGAVLVATDPVSVVSLLRKAKAPSSVSTIISGESLLNDCTAMFMYTYFHRTINGTVYTAQSFIGFLAEMLLLSPLIGFGVGLTCFILSRSTSRPTNLHMNFQIALTFVAAYVSYYVSQRLLGISGVLASCAAGVMMAVLVNPSIMEHPQMHSVWERAEWACNTLVFLLGGFIGGDHTYANFSTKNVALLIVMYVLLMIIRSLMMTTLFPVLSRIGMKMSFAEAKFISFAGLRGALVIALALDASRSARNNGHGDTGGQMFFIATGLVSMTLLLNHTYAGKLMIRLKLVEDPQAPMSVQKRMILLHIKQYLQETVQKELLGLERELGDYDEEEVARLCSLQHSEYGDVNRGSFDINASAPQSKENKNAEISPAGRIRASSAASSDFGGTLSGAGRSSSKAVSEKATTLSEELIAFARAALLDVVKARYMDSIHSGKIGSSVMAAKILLYSVDVAQDCVHESLQDWLTVAASLTPSNGIVAMLRKWDDFFFKTFGKHGGLVPYLDAMNERNALYVLINFIDAHEYALDKLQFMLGHAEGHDDVEYTGSGYTYGGVGGAGGGGKGSELGRARMDSRLTASTDVTRFSQVEMHQVLAETTEHLREARHLLTLINQDHLRLVYTHRAARVILIKQEEILRRMVVEGTLSDTLAQSLFTAITVESDKVNLARAAHDRTLLQETQKRKAEEEQEMRASFSVSLHDKSSATTTGALPATTDAGAFPRTTSDAKGLSHMRLTPPISGGLRRMVSETGAHSAHRMMTNGEPTAGSGLGAGLGAVVSGGAVGGLRRMTSATGDPAFPRRTTETGAGGSAAGTGGAVGGAVGGLRRMSSLTGEQASRASFNFSTVRPPVSRFSSTKEGDEEAVNNPMRK